MRVLAATITSALVLGCATAASATTAPPATVALAPVVELSADRLATAELVAAAKWHSGEPVEAPEREATVLAEAERSARALGGDPETALAVMHDQIEANKVIQRRRHADWYAHPDRSPLPPPPDLADARADLDRITPALVGALTDAGTGLAAPGCEAELARTARRVAAERGLDRPGRTALAVSLSSVCA
ncbi:gamma subclass chorismate mutase AroQ [Nocardiopsis sp. CC223A]|uniref:gamma subclass chorismate mutase AroQ n=1 Tax=Nocardiopsis sp. CC223A TaxID=3044051 RepID=UPI0027953DAE|nr:gamma subclass chorismate mutase AroQ [Nocardiopsis sp. CC223A]